MGEWFEMKRILAALTAALCLCAWLTACGGTAAPEPEPEGQAGELPEQQLLSDWFDYLFASENLYGDMQWAISYINDFLERPSWERLQIARMALNTAKLYIEQREKPEETMTAGEYDRFLQQGMDVSFVHPEIGTFQQGKQSVLTSCLLLEYGLFQDAFGARERTNLAGYTDTLQREFCEEVRYLALCTDNLLLTLGDDDWTRKFRSFVTENCPLIAAEQTDIKDSDALYEQASMALDEIEALRTQQSEELGSARASLNRMKNALENDDLEALAANAAPIDGLPLLLPWPEWYDIENAEYYYYWSGSDGNRTYPAECDDLQNAPDGCVITCPGVSLEALLDYRDALAGTGLACVSTREEDGSCDVYFEVGGSTFVFTWEDGAVQIFMLEEPICLVPVWYFLGLAR